MTRGLAAVELIVVRLPLVEPWVTAAGTTTEREVVLVRVDFDGVEGWGECVAQAEPTYTSEYVEGALDVLTRHLVPRLAASGISDASVVAPALAAIKGHPMAKAALEAAVLDAELRARGVNLADCLYERSTSSPAGTGDGWTGGGRPQTVKAGVAVGIAGSVPALLDEVGRRRSEGYRRVKLKVHPGWDIEPLAAVRDAFPDLDLQVDANGAYAALPRPEAHRALRALDGFDLLLIEQPLGDDDLVGHAELARVLLTPICLDEAITSLEVAETALTIGACSVVNIKAGRVGGYLEAVRIHDLCARRSVPVWCGGMLETGIGRAANLALATLPDFSLPGDLSASRRFWAHDIVKPPAELEADGTILVPGGPGLGVEVLDLRPWVVVRRRLV